MSVDAQRIGAGYGLSGEIYRLRAATSSGADLSLVAKIESADKTRVALTVQRHVADNLGRSMPTLLGVEVMGEAGA